MSEFFPIEDGEQAICELEALNNRLLESAHVGRFFFFFRPSESPRSYKDWGGFMGHVLLQNCTYTCPG